MDRSLSRRELASLFGTAAASVGVAAQAPASQSPGTDLLETVRSDQKQTFAALRNVKLPQLLEPSFTFRPF